MGQMWTVAEKERIEERLITVREVLSYLETDRFMDLKEASEYLSISTRTLRDQDDLPRYRVGKLLRFKKSELDEWMLKHREGGNGELGELVDGVLAKVMGD